MLQNATPLRKSAPGPPNNSDEHVSCSACHGKCIFADPLQMPHACHRFWKCYKTKPPRFAHFWQSAQSLAPATLRSHKSLEKHSVATFLLFRTPGSSFFWSFLFLSFFLLFSSLLFPSLLLLFLFLLLLLLLFPSLLFICLYCRKFDF